MRFACALLTMTLLAFIARSEDYYLSEEEDQELKQGQESNPDDFMKRFSCMVTVYRYVNKNFNQFEKFSERPAYQANLKRLKGGLYADCLEKLPDTILEQFKNAKNSKDVDDIDLSFGHPKDVSEYFKNQDPKLDETEKKNINQLNKIDRELKEMQKKNRRDSPQKDDDDDGEETWDNIRKSKEPPSFGGVSLKSNVVIYSVLIGFLVFGFLIFRISSTLFEDKKKEKKKDKKK